MDDIRQDMEDNFLPAWELRHPGVKLLKGGQAESEEAFFQEVTSLYTVAFFVMYALLAVAFRSYWLPVIVMTATQPSIRVFQKFVVTILIRIATGVIWFVWEATILIRMA